MAREMVVPGGDIGYIAEVDLGEGVGVVPGSTTNGVTLPSADGEKIKGVTLYAVSAGEQVPLRKLGIAEIATSGAFNDGDDLMVEAATGKFKAAAAGAGVRVEVAGHAEEDNAADDTKGYMFLVIGAHFVGS